MRILICMGGMPYSVPTVHFGGLMAQLAGASVVILNVVSSEEERAAAEGALVTARGMLGELEAETKTRWGVPPAEILRESEEGSYDLVVIGARDVLSLAELFMGSIARRSVQRIRASVLVVRRGRPRLKRMLVCTGGWDQDNAVVQMGAHLAQAASAHATLMHVTGTVPSMYKGLDAMQEQLAELLQTNTPIAQHLQQGTTIFEQHGVKAELKLRHGAVASEILLEANQGDYDLIVIGASGTAGHPRGLFMIDVTRQVVDRALRPVLVVRRPRFFGAFSLWSGLKRLIRGREQELP